MADTSTICRPAVDPALPDVSVWTGDYLWPRPDLEDATIIDLSEVTAVGSWLHAWFRGRGQRKVVGAQRRVRQQMQAAGLPILWYATMKEAGHSDHGVTASERAMLWE